MTDLQTISRAILSAVVAAAFLMMSVASGLHGLAHLSSHDHHASATLASASSHHGDDLMRITESGPIERGYEGEICFFCTHGSSVTVTFAKIHLSPTPISLPAWSIPAVPDLVAHAATLPSLRAPPSLA